MPRRFFLLLPILLVAACATGPANDLRLPEFPDAQVSTSCKSTAPASPVAIDVKAAPNPEALVAAVAPSRTARYFLGEGYLAAQAGNRGEAIRFFELAVRFPDNDQPIDRVQWSYGWGMFALGDYACALARFEAARQASPDTITWLPQTLAVVYWRLGNQQRALDWYAVAVRNLASCWADPKAAAYCTRHWRPAEQRALLEVTAAWRAQRFRG
jgi:tetratricopeptide (TPR) repeat protein